MPGNLGFSRLDSGRGALSLMGPSTLLPHGGTSPLSWVQNFFLEALASQVDPVSPSPLYLHLPKPLPPPRPTAEPLLQQALVGALLIGLVGDVGQVDPAECRAMVQDHIAHAEAQHIGL